MIKAEIIADSLNEYGDRLTTFVLTFPRIVLAEFNTHRMFSRNSASSRAIPFKKMLNLVETDPFIPIKWMKEHTGMQGTEFFPEAESGYYIQRWLNARNNAINSARALSKDGVTKQICNRLLEPFMWHTVILTATDFENFFALRAHPDAEIHIADLADKMLIAYNESRPFPLRTGDWHIPFGDKFNDDEIIKRSYNIIAASSEWKVQPSNEEILEKVLDTRRKIAVARCARVSYLNFDGKNDIDDDLKLYHKLTTSGHFSPLEHVAQATDSKYYGNFKGFLQLRKMIHNENKTDSRIIKKK